MNVQFVQPFSRAWDRMKVALFRPFDLHKWFVVGFNAFLAGLMNSTNGSGGAKGREDTSFGEFIHFPRTAWEWLQGHPFWAYAILFAAIVAIAVIVALTWVSSRGVFMFLSSVVHDRVEIAKPWREYQKEGDSLFVWRLGFGLVTFAAFGGILAWFFVRGAALYDNGFGRRIPIGHVLGLALLVLVVVLVIGYIALFLKDFVAALMFKHRISAVAAWRKFLGLFRAYPLHFLAYGIVIFLLMVAYAIAVIFAVIGTCCLGALFLVLPYIGTVVTLPFWYTLRAYSLEFLAQFGPEYDVFLKPPAPEPAAAPAV
jgi:hypothetical protein